MWRRPSPFSLRLGATSARIRSGGCAGLASRPTPPCVCRPSLLRSFLRCWGGAYFAVGVLKFLADMAGFAGDALAHVYRHHSGLTNAPAAITRRRAHSTQPPCRLLGERRGAGWRRQRRVRAQHLGPASPGPARQRTARFRSALAQIPLRGGPCGRHRRLGCALLAVPAADSAHRAPGGARRLAPLAAGLALAPHPGPDPPLDAESRPRSSARRSWRPSTPSRSRWPTARVSTSPRGRSRCLHHAGRASQADGGTCAPVQNLMSVDPQQLMNIVVSFHEFWSLPVQIAGASLSAHTRHICVRLTGRMQSQCTSCTCKSTALCWPVRRTRARRLRRRPALRRSAQAWA